VPVGGGAVVTPDGDNWWAAEVRRRRRTRPERSNDYGFDEVPSFMTATNLKPYVSKDFSVSTIPYQPAGGGPTIQGYDASVCAARSNRRTRRARTDPLACRTRPAHRHLRRTRPAV
jgi:hypothetical protein